MIEQWGPGYGPQVAAMHTLPHAATLCRYARGPIQTPDVQNIRYDKRSHRYSNTVYHNE